MIRVDFSATERRVWLESGEAHFSVTPDKQKPFIVDAAGVTVRAVGTAFSVSHDRSGVAVIVTEGSVRVSSAAAPVTENGSEVSAGHRAVVSLTPNAEPLIVAVSNSEIEERLAWKPRMLDFEDATLVEIAAEFSRRNLVKLVIVDDGLATRRLSAAIRSDNVEGFVRMLTSEFGVRAERPNRSTIELRHAK